MLLHRLGLATTEIISLYSSQSQIKGIRQSSLLKKIKNKTGLQELEWSFLLPLRRRSSSGSVIIILSIINLLLIIY